MRGSETLYLSKKLMQTAKVWLPSSRLVQLEIILANKEDMLLLIEFLRIKSHVRELVIDDRRFVTQHNLDFVIPNIR